MQIQIKHRWTGTVLFEGEFESIKDAVIKAVSTKTNLSDSNLRGSNLRGSNLRGSNLSGSNLSGPNLRGSNLSGSDLSGSNLSGSNLIDSDLSGSNLSGSNLSGSNLRGSNLSGSDLSGSNLSGSNLIDSDLSGSNLSGSNLRGSNLRGSNLSGSNLRGSNLRGSNLSGSNLTPIRDDVWAVLSSAPREVGGLRLAIVEGRVEGSTYSGECACLVGTLRSEAMRLSDTSHCLLENSRRPAEMFFLSIRKGDTPETNQCSKIALEWVDMWLSNMRSAFSPATAPKTEIINS